MYELKIYRELFVIMENDAKLEEEMTCRFKFWPKHSKTIEICTLMGSFWSQYKISELKNNTGAIFDGTEDWCKTWRKTDFCFLKWHEEFGKFSFMNWKIAKSFEKVKWQN